MPKEEIERLYKKEKVPRVKERLQAILLLLDGKTAIEVASILRRNERTIRRWAKAWNEKGYEGLKPWKGQKKKPRISEEEWREIGRMAVDKKMTLKEIYVYIRDKYGDLVSYKTTWYWLRKKLKLRYGKPYVRDERRPGNAEEILKKIKRSAIRSHELGSRLLR